MKDTLLVPDSTKKNFIFQTFYQAVILLIPLCIAPYLTRTLGGDALGRYTYTYSVAYYFILFGMLGITRHGQREIASNRNNLISLRTSFWELFWLHIWVSSFMLVMYVVYVVLLCEADSKLAYIQAINVAAGIFDITWLFYGLEKFKIVSIRNAIIKILNMVAIFSFVKSEKDIYVYTGIMVISSLFGQLVMLPKVLKEIPPIHIKMSKMCKHLKPLLVLFVGTVAVTLYTMFDKTLLGIMRAKEEVAFYDYSDKIVNIPKTFLSIVSTILYPKACMYAADKNIKMQNENAKLSMRIVAIGCGAFCFGLFAVAREFSYLYYGKNFIECGGIIMAMVPLICIIHIGEIYRTQYMYADKRDNIMVGIVCVNSICNLIVSIILIPRIGVYGSVAGSWIAETVGLVITIIYVNKKITRTRLLIQFPPFILCGLIMYGVTVFIGNMINDITKRFLIKIIVGVCTYIISILVYSLLNSEFKKQILNVMHSLKKRS